MIIIRKLLIVSSLSIIFTGCAEFLVTDRIKIDTDTPNSFDSPLFTDYETYQDALQGLDKIDFMNDDELEDLLFSDDYRIYPEFLSYIDHYKQLKEEFTGESKIRSNIRFIMTDLRNITTEAAFRKFKNTDRLKGIAGQCGKMILSSGIPLRLVTIDYTFWNLSFPSEQRGILFHELGHCDLDRREELEGALSLMGDSGILLKERYLAQRLYEELFDPEKMNNRNTLGTQRFKRYEENYFLDNE